MKHKKLAWLVLGIFFGLALSKVGASTYDRIYGMFRLTDLTLYGVIGTAVVVGLIGMQILLKKGKTIDGQQVKVDRAPLTWRHAVGGLIFGIGWAMTGACPGTVATQLGEGKVLSIFTFGGLLLGTYLYAVLVKAWPILLPKEPRENS